MRSITERERRHVIAVAGKIASFSIQNRSEVPIDPQDLKEEILARIEKIASDNGGVLQERKADFFLILFNVERSTGTEPDQTVVAIEQIRRALAGIERRHHVRLTVGIGAATGTAAIGRKGRKRTVSGVSLDTARSLSEQASGSDTLLSRPLADLLDGVVLTEPFGPGTRGSVRKVLGRKPTWRRQGDLLGRESELEEYKRRLDHFLSVESAPAFWIVGEAGIGKTRLLEQFKDIARATKVSSGTLYFQSQASALHVPFEALIRKILFGEFIPFSKSDVLRRVMFSEPGFWQGASFDQLAALFRHTLELATDNGPLILFVENYHAGPSTARELLDRTWEAFSKKPVWIVGTSRIRFPQFENVLELAGLSSTASEALFRAIASEDPKTPVRSMIEECKGNALFIQELARTVRDHPDRIGQLSGRVEFLIESALDSCTIQQQRVIQRAALFGGSAIRVTQLAGLEGMSARDLLSLLEPTGMFRRTSDGSLLVFRHELIREVAQTRTPTDRKRVWHGRIARTIAGLGAPVEDLAHHFSEAGDLQQATRYSIEAARKYLRSPQREEALRFSKRAMNLAVKGDNADSLVEAFALHFEAEARNLSLPKAFVLLDEQARDLGLNSLDTGLIRARLAYQRREYVASKKEMDGVAAEHLTGRRKFEAAILKNRILVQLGQRPDVVRSVMETLRSPGLSRSDQGHLWSILGYVAFRDREIQQAGEFYKKAEGLFKRAQDFDGLRKTQLNLGAVAVELSDYQAGAIHFQQAQKMALEMGDIEGHCMARLNLARCRFNLALFEESLLDYRENIAVLESGFSESLLNQARVYYGHTLRVLGELRESEKLFRVAEVFFRNNGDSYRLGQALRAHAALCLEQRRYSIAERLLTEARELLANAPDQLQHVMLLSAETLFAQKRRAKAAIVLGEFENQFPQSKRSPYCSALFARLRSTLSGRSRDEDLRRIREVLSQYEGKVEQTERLALMAESLEYGKDPKVLVMAKTLVRQLGLACPPEYRRGFLTKPMFLRLRVLVRN